MTTAKEQIEPYLDKHGSATTSEMAKDLGYSTGHILGEAKKLMNEGKITGSKNTRIPAYIIDDDYVVATDDRENLLSIIKKYQPSLLSTARSRSTEGIQKLIKNRVAERTVGGPFIWEFRK